MRRLCRGWREDDDEEVSNEAPADQTASEARLREPVEEKSADWSVRPLRVVVAAVGKRRQRRRWRPSRD